MPRRRARLVFERALTSDEHARAARGFIPQEMEDKWFIFLDGEWLSFHHSWTGICTYRVRLETRGDGYAVTETWVNREPRQYQASDDAFETALLGFLIDRLLLGRESPFPYLPHVAPEAQPAARWSLVGEARASDEPLPTRFQVLPPELPAADESGTPP